jgi:hypothetical protein
MSHAVAHKNAATNHRAFWHAQLQSVLRPCGSLPLSAHRDKLRKLQLTYACAILDSGWRGLGVSYVSDELAFIFIEIMLTSFVRQCSLSPGQSMKILISLRR